MARPCGDGKESNGQCTDVKMRAGLSIRIEGWQYLHEAVADVGISWQIKIRIKEQWDHPVLHWLIEVCRA